MPQQRHQQALVLLLLLPLAAQMPQASQTQVPQLPRSAPLGSVLPMG